MSMVETIILEALQNLYRPAESLEALDSWIRECLDSVVVDEYYISRHPDSKESPETEIIISILTSKTLHTIDIKSTSKDIYNYIPLKSIEWIKEFQPKFKDSYIIQVFIPKTVLTISDFIGNRGELQDFSNKIKKAIEELE